MNQIGMNYMQQEIQEKKGFFYYRCRKSFSSNVKMKRRNPLSLLRIKQDNGKTLQIQMSNQCTGSTTELYAKLTPSKIPDIQIYEPQYSDLR